MLNGRNGNGMEKGDAGSLQPRPAIQWRLRQVMTERGVLSATELQRMLANAGVKISRQQLSRLVSEMPKRLPVDLLAGLAHVLRCGQGDLLRVGKDLETEKGDGDLSTSSIPPPMRDVDRGRRKGRPGYARKTANRICDQSPLGGDWVDRFLAFPLRPYGSARPDNQDQGKESK